MSKKRLELNWKCGTNLEDLKPAIKRFRRYLEDNGLRASTIPMYILSASKYLEFSETDLPNADDFAKFRDHLHDRRLSRLEDNCSSVVAAGVDCISHSRWHDISLDMLYTISTEEIFI